MPDTSTGIDGGTGRALVGRDAERAALQAFLARLADGGGGALVLRGEGGIGRTALLDAAVDPSAHVVRGSGVPGETHLGYAVLHQLLAPVLAGTTAVPAPPLAVALGLEEGPDPHPPDVAAAAVPVLAAAGPGRPLLLVVDDLHLVDDASAEVLRLLASAGSGVGLLAATRTVSGPTGLPVLDVGPLDDAASETLLAQRWPQLGRAVVRRVLAEAGGNPLALGELPAALTAGQRAAREPLPPVLPLTPRLAELFAAPVAGLPPGTRDLLLAAALEGSGDLHRLAGAADRSAAEELAPAVAAGLVVVDPTARRLRFRSPLVGATVVATASAPARRAAHRGLARAVAGAPDRRAWHLAEATVTTDEGVARLLEETAHAALRRGEATAGAGALLRAAALSPRPADESRRLARAARVTPGGAARLLLRARRADPGGTGPLAAVVATAQLLLDADGDVDTASRLLLGALTSGAPDPRDPDVRDALTVLSTACSLGQRAELWRALRDVRARLGAGPPDPWEELAADPARAPLTGLSLLDDAVAGSVAGTDPAAVDRLARAATFVDRLPACRDALERVAGAGEVGTGALAAHVHLCVDDVLSGRWDDARRRIDEALPLARLHGATAVAWALRSSGALLAAVRGRPDTVRALADAITAWAAPRGADALTHAAQHARALSALGSCRFDDAFRAAAAVSPPGQLRPAVPRALWVAPDLVEAAVRTHRRAEAAAHVRALQEADVAARSPRLALLTAGCAALAAPDGHAVEQFEAALALPGGERWPFDVARVHLAYGERLRRLRSTTSARTHLAVAREAFEGLGAAPWATRAGTELQATGPAGSRPPGRGRPRLTPQEREVAVLAASGLTNRQIADRLLLSPRTVGAHLRQVFPKVGVTSRTALRSALPTAGIPAPRSPRPAGGGW